MRDTGQSLQHGLAKDSVTDDLLRHTDPMARSFSISLAKNLGAGADAIYEGSFEV